jgi:hypothetical protein
MRANGVKYGCWGVVFILGAQCEAGAVTVGPGGVAVFRGSSALGNPGLMLPPPLPPLPTPQQILTPRPPDEFVRGPLNAACPPSISRVILAKPPTEAYATGPKHVVFDSEATSDSPRNYRRFASQSGSGEFTAQGLAAILRAAAPRPVTIFDLRQESHGYVNGLPATVYAKRDWANVGVTTPDVPAVEARDLSAVAQAGQVSYLNTKMEKAGVKSSPFRLPVEQVQNEAQLVAQAAAGLPEAQRPRYERIGVTDHLRPSDADLDRFIAAVRAMPPDGWAHFHCRAGKGRTTTFMALYDMLQNANTVSFEEIIRRQADAAHGFDLLAERGNPESWKQPYAEDRANLLKAFYPYAQNFAAGGRASWSEWLHAPSPAKTGE